jgi:hypothetical protein
MTKSSMPSRLTPMMVSDFRRLFAPDGFNLQTSLLMIVCLRCFPNRMQKYSSLFEPTVKQIFRAPRRGARQTDEVKLTDASPLPVHPAPLSISCYQFQTCCCVSCLKRDKRDSLSCVCAVDRARGSFSSSSSQAALLGCSHLICRCKGAGHPITHTCKCFSRCRRYTRS